MTLEMRFGEVRRVTEEDMIPRERVRMALNHEEPDRVPIHDLLWESTIERWRKEGLPSTVTPSDYFGYEIARFSPDLTPRFEEEKIEENEHYIIERNRFGEIVKHHKDRSTTPQVIQSPMETKQDWEELRKRLAPDNNRMVSQSPLPKPGSYKSMAQALQDFHVEREKGRFVVYMALMGYDWVQRHMGTERLLMATATDPEWVKEMYLYVAELIINMCEVMTHEGFQFDGAYFCDDLGYRNGLLFSPVCYKEQLFPAHKRVCDYFKGKNLPVILHSCGRVEELIPEFIRAGFSCIQPLEVKAGMDVRRLKVKFGDALSFMGGIDSSKMCSLNPEEIEEEIRSKFQIAKKGGGYIYHSDHSVPKDVSFKQYQRVIKYARQYGTYE